MANPRLLGLMRGEHVRNGKAHEVTTPYRAIANIEDTVG
jgi:hypothetical protein